MYHHNGFYIEQNMIKTIVKHGNSRAVVLEKPILKLLNITDKTKLKITTDGNVLMITPICSCNDKKSDKMGFDSALNWVNKNYQEVLKKLA
jgi:Growth regulator